MTQGEVAKLIRDEALTAALLDVHARAQALWIETRDETVLRPVAGLFAQAYAALDRAVSEAERAGIVVVERDAQRRVTAIRGAEGNDG